MLIHLQPELIEKVNKHIVTIIKMPETCYEAHKCLENSEVMIVLQKAAQNYKSSAYQLAITHYKNAISLLKDEYLEKSLLTVIQYMICKCLIATSQLASLIEAETTLINLIDTTQEKYPMLYYQLSNLYVKTFCYKEAEKIINICLSILSPSKNFTVCKIPGTDDVIHESNYDELPWLLVSLKEECSGWHRPDAVCFMKSCKTNSMHTLIDRDIYFKSPAFNGLVVVTCNSNINPCVFNFHINCWKVKKEELSPNIKLSDKDFLNWKCFTPNCENSFNEPSVISKIEIFNSDNTIKSRIVLTEKVVKQQQTPSKGAVRKQQVNKVTPTIPRPRNTKNIFNESNNNQSNRIKNNEYNKKIKSKDEITLISHLIKLIQVRNSNWGIKTGQEWRPDLPYYGDSSMIVDEEQYSDLIDVDNEDLKQKKSFLYSYFYHYVSSNAPVKKDTLIKKWKEAKTLITDCETVLYELNCPTIIEFLLKSMKFAMVGEYICTPATLQEAYKRVNDNVCGMLKCLMNKDVDSDISDDDLVDEELLKRLESFHADGKLDTEEDSKATDLERSKVKEDLKVNENNDEEIHVQAVKSEDPKNTVDNDQTNIEKISGDTSSINVGIQNNVEEKLVIENENENENEKQETVELKDYPMEEDSSDKKSSNNDIIIDNQGDQIDNEPVKVKVKVCNKTCRKLADNLQKTKQDFEQCKTEFLNWKVNSLKNMLYVDYLDKKNVILFNIRIARTEFAIVDKLQSILIYSIGSMLPLKETEWTTPLQQLEKLSLELDRDFYLKLGLINDEYCKTVDTIACVNNELPPLPNKDLPSLIDIAFNMQRNYLCRPQPNLNRPPMAYPPGFNNMYANPLLMQHQQRPQFWQQPVPPVYLNPQQFMQKNTDQAHASGWNFKAMDNVNNGYQNNFSRQRNPQAASKQSNSEFINYDELNSKKNEMKEETHSFNYKESPESLNNDKVLLDFDNNEDNTKELEDWKFPWVDEINPLQQASEEIISELGEEKMVLSEQEPDSETEHKKTADENLLKEEIIRNKPKSSMDKLMNELRARNKGVLEYDLLYCIQLVRKRYNNSLTGLTLAKIIEEVEKRIPNREKIQLSNYNNRFFSSLKKRSESKKLQKVQVTSESSPCPSVKTMPRVTSKNNPWATLDSLQWTHEGSDENECIICMETIVKFGKVPSYTLRCQHTFHKKCIQNWFSQDQSCPICRIHSTIDDEFPPLS